jgi:hypothetical protein
VTVGDWIQSASVVVGIGAAIVALVIASRDRRAAAKQERLRFELDAALRLAANLAQGGTADNDTAAQLERKRMGAEALVLTGLLGRDRMPTYWVHKFETDDKLKQLLADPGTPQFRRDAIEASLAVNAIAEDLRRAEGRRASKRRARARN